MVFPALNRSARSLASAVAAVLLTSMLVVTAAPAVASPLPSAVVDPGYTGFEERLPHALAAAAAVAAQEPGEQSPDTALVTGTVVFPAGIDLTAGRTLVAAYAPGAADTSPLAAAVVDANGAYTLTVPVGDVVLAVLSEGRAVFDRWGQSGAGVDTAELTAVTAEGVTHDVTLTPSAQVTGTVSVPSGVVIAAERIAVAVYPAGGAGQIASAANYVTTAGSYVVGGLPAGEYRVAFVSAIPGASSEWWDAAPSFAKAKPLALTTDSRPVASASLDALRLMDTTVPTISGTPTVGQKLTAAPGAWTAGAALTYQWYANGAAIAKATASTLVIPVAVAGKKITVRVTGKKAAYTTAALTSSATAAVVQPLVAPVPTVAGTLIVGQTLKATPGTWTAGTKLTYQWYIGGVAVAKATAATFKIPAAATRKTITVVVRGAKAGYATAAKRSKATAEVKGILSAPVPRITGSVIVGSRLTAVPGTWTSGTTLRYQWYMNGRAITRATGSTLVVTAAMVKSRITVTVSGSRSGYVAAGRTSAPTGVVSYPSRTAPSSTWNCPAWAPIKGNAQSGIYHVPSGASYSKTKPEECFSSESAAVKAGYRKAKR